MEHKTCCFGSKSNMLNLLPTIFQCFLIVTAFINHNAKPVPS